MKRVLRFKTPEEAEKALHQDPEAGTPRRLRLFFRFAQSLRSLAGQSKRPFPKGLRRYRSLDEER